MDIITKTGKLKQISESQPDLAAEEIIRLTLEEYGSENVVLASSLSIEDQVLTHMLAGMTEKPRIFTLDTGRLFAESYETMEKTMLRYGFRFELLCPENSELEKMIEMHGPNLFYRSIELRKLCCTVRKVQPLQRVLATANAWMCGLRRTQSITRDELKAVEWDENNDITKVNPLHNWTEDQVWEFVRSNDIPYSSLQDRGFRSIGCAPCTRSVSSDDDMRAGRWWWEEPEHKECGLHLKPKNDQR